MPGDRRTPVRESFDAASRTAALKLAEKIGDKAAAKEIGCQPATIRSWRSRAKPQTLTVAEHDGSDADALAARAAVARQDGDDAQAKVRDLMTEGRASDARALSQVVKDRSEQASRLEADARATREHELRVKAAETALRDEHIRLFQLAVRTFVRALGLGWGRAHDDLVWALLRALANAERDEHGKVVVGLPEPETSDARAAIDRVLVKREEPDAEDGDEPDEPESEHDGEADAIREDYPETSEGPRAPVEKSAVAIADSTPAPDVLASAPEPDDLPAWDDLPADWKQRFALRRDLGRYEFAQELERERHADEQRTHQPRRPSRADALDFTHPGLKRRPR
jgi:hypothetical protein